MQLINTMQLQTINPNEDKTNPLYASEDCQQLIDVYNNYYPQIGFHKPWHGYFILRQNQVVGCCGFVQQPQNNQVEVSYGTFKQFEGQGIASFACQQLISIAWQNNPQLIITAKTEPRPNASTKILQKHNFVYSHVVQDHEIGDAWFWLLNPTK